jgi:indole-3-glycerol phosphate synthase
MRRAGEAGARIIGVNNRDLRTFDVSLETSVGLVEYAPPGALLVSESGIRDAKEIARLRASGFSAFLIGETLMRAGGTADTLRALARLTEDVESHDSL